MKYTYCPTCGRKLTPKRAGDDGDVPYCEHCNKYWFEIFSSVSIIMVVNEYDEIAMIQQHYLSDEYWTYVAGFIKPGETAEETAVREVREEIGLDIDSIEYAGTYWYAANEQLMHGFIGYARKADFKLSREVSRAEWVKLDEAPSRMFPEMPGNTLQPIYNLYLKKLEERSAV